VAAELDGAASNAGNIGLWRSWEPPTAEEGEAYTGLIDSVRRFQALLTGSRPSAQTSTELTGLIDRAVQALIPVQVGEGAQIAGKYTEAPGRAQALVPTLHFERAEQDFVTGKVTFSRYYLGGGGAAHGGTLPLVFDELLGRLVGGFGRPPSRTAYLTVNFRKITPIDKELTFEGKILKVEGRKRFVQATLTDGEYLLADADGLFITLNPGQP
jgi:acyl-coenzyme A thioesterase PaaI-like protein